MSTPNSTENPFPLLRTFRGKKALCSQRLLDIYPECFNGSAEIDSSGKAYFELPPSQLVYKSCLDCPTGNPVLESQK
jgi:hypothetical protein